MAPDNTSSPAVDRLQLVLDTLDLVGFVARGIHARCHRYIDLDELIAYGNVGLVEAAARFDPTRGVSFWTFAHYRVQGAILDGLRRSTVLPRREWRRLEAIRAVAAHLEQRCLDAARAGAAVPEHERIRAMTALRDAFATVRTIYVRSLADTQDGDVFAEEDATARRDCALLAHRLAAGVEALPDRERAMVRKHYWEDKNIMEAGIDLGVSKTTASRVHDRAVHRLRQWFGLERRAWCRTRRRRAALAVTG